MIFIFKIGFSPINYSKILNENQAYLKSKYAIISIEIFFRKIQTFAKVYRLASSSRSFFALSDENVSSLYFTHFMSENQYSITEYAIIKSPNFRGDIC